MKNTRAKDSKNSGGEIEQKMSYNPLILVRCEPYSQEKSFHWIDFIRDKNLAYESLGATFCSKSMTIKRVCQTYFRAKDDPYTSKRSEHCLVLEMPRGNSFVDAVTCRGSSIKWCLIVEIDISDDSDIIEANIYSRITEWKNSNNLTVTVATNILDPVVIPVEVGSLCRGMRPPTLFCDLLDLGDDYSPDENIINEHILPTILIEGDDDMVELFYTHILSRWKESNIISKLRSIIRDVWKYDERDNACRVMCFIFCIQNGFLKIK